MTAGTGGKAAASLLLAAAHVARVAGGAGCDAGLDRGAVVAVAGFFGDRAAEPLQRTPTARASATGACTSASYAPRRGGCGGEAQEGSGGAQEGSGGAQEGDAAAVLNGATQAPWARAPSTAAPVSTAALVRTALFDELSPEFKNRVAAEFAALAPPARAALAACLMRWEGDPDQWPQAGFLAEIDNALQRGPAETAEPFRPQTLSPPALPPPASPPPTSPPPTSPPPASPPPTSPPPASSPATSSTSAPPAPAVDRAKLCLLAALLFRGSPASQKAALWFVSSRWGGSDYPPPSAPDELIYALFWALPGRPAVGCDGRGELLMALERFAADLPAADWLVCRLALAWARAEPTAVEARAAVARRIPSLVRRVRRALRELPADAAVGGGDAAGDAFRSAFPSTAERVSSPASDFPSLHLALMAVTDGSCWSALQTAMEQLSAAVVACDPANACAPRVPDTLVFPEVTCCIAAGVRRQFLDWDMAELKLLAACCYGVRPRHADGAGRKLACYAFLGILMHVIRERQSAAAEGVEANGRADICLGN